VALLRGGIAAGIGSNSYVAQADRARSGGSRADIACTLSK
jgi:hypothetical protein